MTSACCCGVWEFTLRYPPSTARGMLGQDFPFLRDQLVPTRIENVSFGVAREQSVFPRPLCIPRHQHLMGSHPLGLA